MSIEIKQNIPLAHFTTFKIGGPAEFFVEVASREELIEACEWAVKNNKKITVLGGGSNVLISDKGISGLVLRIKNNSLSFDGNMVSGHSGAILSKIVLEAQNKALAGLEWAIGIPGTLGGAIRGNAGAYGNSTADSIVEVEFFDLNNNQFKIINKADCKFVYRGSIFKENNNLIIWEAKLKLADGNIEEMKETIKKLITQRISSQPKFPSAGSVFKNLTIDELRAFNAGLADEFEAGGSLKGGKIGAGRIIDMAGLKGKTIGGAKISEEHANFIINTGTATADDVMILISLIKQQVRDKYGVQLHEEIQYLD